jgi:tRNA dimethylallyltransferase
MELAGRLPGVEIVCVDSMQVYRGMDIGTSKPSAADRAAVRHHLLDVADPSEDFSVATFQRLARGAVDDIESRGHRALLVAGTGLYLRAIVDDLDIPGDFPDVRAELEAEADSTVLHRRLMALDPSAAARMEPGNRRRVVRALEVTLGAARPFSSFGPGLDVHRGVRFLLAGIWLPRAVVADRIDARFDAMLAGGLLDEVATLARPPAGLSRTARQAVGYAELLAHLEGRSSLADGRAEAIRRTRHLARRQRVWFRRDPRVVWHGTGDNPLAVVPALLGDWTARCQH